MPFSPFQLIKNEKKFFFLLSSLFLFYFFPIFIPKNENFYPEHLHKSPKFVDFTPKFALFLISRCFLSNPAEIPRGVGDDFPSNNSNFGQFLNYFNLFPRILGWNRLRAGGVGKKRFFWGRILRIFSHFSPFLTWTFPVYREKKIRKIRFKKFLLNPFFFHFPPQNPNFLKLNFSPFFFLHENSLFFLPPPPFFPPFLTERILSFSGVFFEP